MPSGVTSEQAQANGLGSNLIDLLSTNLARFMSRMAGSGPKGIGNIFPYLLYPSLKTVVGDLDYILSSMIPLSSVKYVKKQLGARAPRKYYAGG